MALTPLDHERLRQALVLAEHAIGLSDPNPRVGCIIGRDHAAGGALLGSGHTQAAGGAHAEMMALNDARSRGLVTRGATAWVTLEPCAHHGRTPPCCDALIEAGVARVVVAVSDPYPQVAGEGIRRLRAAGIDVEVADDEASDVAGNEAGADLAQAARDLNIGFFHRILHGRPWVRMKLAATLDGRTALNNGVSQWITGEAARIDGHRWRRRAGAMLSGIGTVLADDPRLDVRHVASALQPLRVIVDSALRTPASARLLAPPGQALIITAARAPERQMALETAGARVYLLAGDSGQVDLPALLALLAERGINELHLEAGARLNAAMLAAGLVDELLVYLAPMLAGPGVGMVAWPALVSLADAQRFDFVESVACGNDLRLRCRLAAVVGKLDKIGPCD